MKKILYLVLLIAAIGGTIPLAVANCDNRRAIGQACDCGPDKEVGICHADDYYDYRCNCSGAKTLSGKDLTCYNALRGGHCKEVAAMGCVSRPTIADGWLFPSTCKPVIDAKKKECQTLLQTSCNCEDPRTHECMEMFPKFRYSCGYCSDKYCELRGEGYECSCNDGKTRWRRCVKEGNSYRCDCNQRAIR